jgi:DNA helicase HerA-like ATPase
LAPGLLSECNTIFALRMTNHDDQEIVRGAVPEASHGLLNFLPALRNGEAIAAGEGVSMPMRVCFDLLAEDRRPKSATASFTASWSQESEGSQVERVVERWRRGERHMA